MTNRGWKKFSELSIGDWILNRSPEKNNNFQLLGELPIEKESLYHNGNGVNPINLPEKMSVNFAKFLGMLCADGSTIESSGCICLTTADNDVEKTFTDLCIEIFGIMPRFTKDIRTKNTRSLSITSRPLVRMIQKLIGKGCINKKIPDQILQGSYEEKKAFIEGVTLDGYIKSTGNNKTIPQKKSLCIYEGYSEILAKQLYMCLIELGTIPRINFKKVRYHGKDQGNAWGVFIYENILTPIEKHKQYPLSKRKVYVDSKIILPDIDNKSYLYNQLSKLRKYTGIIFDETCEKYYLPYDKNLFYSKITNIENSSNDIYDIEVEDSHTYLIGNLISHNTINISENSTIEDIMQIYLYAFKKGVKGITIYRDNSKSFQILEKPNKDK